MAKEQNRATPEDTAIAFIGTGVMGTSMATHLIDAGYDLTIFTRTKEKAQTLLDKGASWAPNVAAAVYDADVVITMVGFPTDVEEVYMDQDGILDSAKEGAYLVDMTTSRPSLAEDIFLIAETKGLHAVDAPVSGGDLGARNAALTIMVGGKEEDFAYLLPLFEIMGKKILLQGKAGCGQHTKMANQISIAGTMLGAVESIAYAQNAGLDPLKVLESVTAGSGTSWSLENLGPRILEEDFKPGFYVKHFLKDMQIAIDSADEMNLVLPGLETARQLYTMLVEVGGHDLGTQGLWLLYATEEKCAENGLDMEKLQPEEDEMQEFEFDFDEHAHEYHGDSGHVHGHDNDHGDDDGSSFLDSPFLNEN